MSNSERIYRLFLTLYPREHRRHYEELMVTHFRDQLKEARRERAVLHLWLRTLIDVVTTVPLEHMQSAGMHYVYPWSEVLLAILPTSVLLFLPPQSDQIERFVLLGLGLIYLAIVVVYRSQDRPAAWIIPILGLAGTYSVFWVFSVLLGEWRWGGEYIPFPLVYLLPAGIVVLTRSIRDGNRLTLVLFGILMATSPGVYLLQGEGSLAAGGALEVPALFLLAAALGLPFASRYGFLGTLFMVGSAQMAIEFTIDPSLQIRFDGWPRLLSLLNLGTTLIIIPFLTLRARSGLGRVLAFLLPLATCLLLLIVLPPLIYTYSPYTAGHVDTAGLVERAIYLTNYAVQILVGMAFALTLNGPKRKDDLRASRINN